MYASMKIAEAEETLVWIVCIYIRLLELCHSELASSFIFIYVQISLFFCCYIVITYQEQKWVEGGGISGNGLTGC